MDNGSHCHQLLGQIVFWLCLQRIWLKKLRKPNSMQSLANSGSWQVWNGRHLGRRAQWHTLQASITGSARGSIHKQLTQKQHRVEPRPTMDLRKNERQRTKKCWMRIQRKRRLQTLRMRFPTRGRPLMILDPKLQSQRLRINHWKKWRARTLGEGVRHTVCMTQCDYMLGQQT